jgi:outer membrane protein OmpA-like peptidoglycan-associated protein
MKTLSAMVAAACLFVGGGALAQGAPAAKPSAAPTAEDYTNALMNLDCPTCEGKVQNLRGFSLAAPPAAEPSRLGTARKPSPPKARSEHADARVASPGAPPARVSAADLQLNFRLGSAELTAQGEANARNFAHALNDPRLADASFEIVGHTDATGSPDRNLTLSRARAEAVKTYLVQQGVAATRLRTRGVGSQDLAVPANPAAAANRRVEVRRAG